MNNACYAGDKVNFLGFMGPILLILIHLYQNREFSFLDLKKLSFHAISARKYTDKQCTGKRIVLLSTSHSCIVVSEDQGYLNSSNCIAGPGTCLFQSP